MTVIIRPTMIEINKTSARHPISSPSQDSNICKNKLSRYVFNKVRTNENALFFYLYNQTEK